MSQYIIRLIAKVSWEGQANGLPKELYAFRIYDDQGDGKAATRDIVDIIEQETMKFIRIQSFLCQKNQGQVIDLNQTPAERMLVPFRWLVNISADVNRLGAELSIPDENKVERLTDGKEPLKN